MGPQDPSLAATDTLPAVAEPPAKPPPGSMARRRKAVEGRVEDYPPRPKRSEFDEFPSDEDIQRFGDVTVTCPECGTELYDDAEVCWNCAHALGARARAGEGIPRWVIVVAVIAAAALAMLAIF